jgi:hypothetical protein
MKQYTHISLSERIEIEKLHGSLSIRGIARALRGLACGARGFRAGFGASQGMLRLISSRVFAGRLPAGRAVARNIC